MLAQRNAVEEAASMLSSKHASDARISALWALIRMQKDDARDAVRGMLADKDNELQKLAVYGVGLWRDTMAAPSLRTLLGSRDPHLSRGAAEALGRTGDKGSLNAILEAAPNERFGFHAAAYALYETGDPAAVKAAAKGKLGVAAAVAQTALSMLSLPQPPSVPALPLVTPSAPPDPALRQQQFARVHELLSSLKNGAAPRGEILFKSERARCTACHAVSGEGGNLGPDLTKIGAIRTATDLLEAIVFPSSSYVRSYEPILVRLKSGVEHYGMIRDETPETIRLATGPDTEVPLPRREIDTMSEGMMSLMPPGFDGVLAAQELVDLVTYLLTLR
jgi:putative heme-binding domain-containing protein